MNKIEKTEHGIYGIFFIYALVMIIFTVFGSKRTLTEEEKFNALSYNEKLKVVSNYCDSVITIVTPMKAEKDSLDNLLKTDLDSLERIKIKNRIDILKGDAQKLFGHRTYILKWSDQNIK